MTYYPALDGIRALAIGLVLLLHASYGHLPGGFLGVDMFFVLSGFLITGVLLQPKITIKAFYLRRARRLLPALACMMIVALVLWKITNPDLSYVRAAIPVALYFSDFQAMVQPTHLGTMLHTWSLSIEEQFYFIWPIILLTLLAREKQPRASRIFLLAIGVAVMRAAVTMRFLGNKEYFCPLTRVDTLLVGCGLALATTPLRSRLVAWLFLATLPILFLKLVRDNPRYFEVVIPWVSFGTAAMIAECIATGPSLLKRLLSLPILVWVGKRSYGIYLYHLPIFVALEGFKRPHSIVNFVVLTGVRFAIAIVVAALSFRFIERPFLGQFAPRQLDART